MASLDTVRTLADVSVKLKSLRLEQNRTQEEVCAAVGLSRRALSALESGSASDIRLQTLLKLLRYFKCQLMMAPESPVPTLEELDFERQLRAPSSGASTERSIPRERAAGQRGLGTKGPSSRRSKRMTRTRPR